MDTKNAYKKRSSNRLVVPIGKRVAIDVETTGFNPYVGDRMFAWSYFTDEGEYGFFLKSPSSMRLLRILLQDSSRSIYFHNAKFDLKMMWFEDIDVFALHAKVYCTLIMSKLYNESFYSHELRDLGRIILKRSTADKDGVTEWLRENKRAFTKEHERPPTFADAPLELVKARCLWDTETTLLLGAYLHPRVDAICPKLHEQERMLMFAVLDMENTGVRVDITRARELTAKAQSDLHKIETYLDKLVCPLKGIKRGKTQNETTEHLNPNSGAELEAAFIGLGIRLRYKTKPKKRKRGKKKRTSKARWSFDEYAMVRYVDAPLKKLIRKVNDEGMEGDEYLKQTLLIIKKHRLNSRQALPPLVLKYRELSKMCNTFYAAIIEQTVDRTTVQGREYGTLHCHFNQSQALTGRFSSSGPNLQNIPRILGPRECFVPRPGRYNWHLDYSQIEMRFFVHFARDKKMAKAIDADIHLSVACEIYSLPPKKVSAEQRKRAKSVNFGIIYGAGVNTLTENMLKKGLDVTRSEVTRMLAAYHRKYPSVRQLMQALKIKLHRDGYIVNPFGRRYHIDVDKAYKGVNNLVQGTSADEMKRSMLRAWMWLRKHRYRTRLIMTIHDELVFEIPRNEERTVPAALIRLMKNEKEYFVPIHVEAKVVRKRWSQKVDPKKVGLLHAA